MSGIYFEIQADNVNRASSFYTAVFGWTFSEVQGLSIPYWRIETDSGSGGGLLKRPGRAASGAKRHERLRLLL